MFLGIFVSESITFSKSVLTNQLNGSGGCNPKKIDVGWQSILLSLPHELLDFSSGR